MTASAHGYEDKEDTGKISYRYKSKLGMVKRKIKVAKTLWGGFSETRLWTVIMKRLNLQQAGSCPDRAPRVLIEASARTGGAVGGEAPAGRKNKSAHGQGIPLGLEIVAHLYEHSAHLWLHIMSLNSIPSQLLPAVQMLAGTSSTRLLLTPKSFD